MAELTRCQACGRPARDGDPIVTVNNNHGPDWPATSRVHESHTTNPKSGFYGAEVTS